MNVHVLFFAQARERVGLDDATFELPAGGRARDVLDAVVRAHPALAPMRAHLAVAVNGQITPPEAPVPDGAEVAILPPVSGG